MAARGFGRNISYEKFLREPMTKDFFEIFKFLIAQLDPNLEIDGKIEDEVPLIMKRLKYPVEVNRSKCSCISGPNTWPQLLAVLDWLITLIQVNDNLIAPFAECEQGLADGDEENHHLLRTLHDNYLLFLSGKDDDSVEERLRLIYEERAGNVQCEVERLQEEMTRMQAQLHDFRAEHDRLLEIQAAPKHLEAEAELLRGAIQSQEVRAQRADEDAVQVEAEERTIVKDIESLEVQRRGLQDQVESQAYSKRDIDRLKQERAHLRRMVQDLKGDSEKAEQNVWELGIEESRLEESISRAVRYVNEKKEMVENVVSMVEDAGPQELNLHVDLAEPTDALAALDFSKLGANMEKVVDAHSEAARLEDVVVHEVGEEQRSVHEELSQKERVVERLKQRRQELTRMREEYRVWSDNELDDARQTAEGAEDNARAAAMVTEAPTVSDLAEVDELRLHLSELKNAFEAERKVAEERLRKEQEAIGLHQNATKKEFKLALDDMEHLRDDVGARVTELGSVEDAEAPRPSPTRGGC